MNLKSKLNSAQIVIIFSLAFAFIGYVVATTFLLKYKSEGILTIDMSGAEYKRFAEATSSISSLKQAFTAIPPKSEEDKSEIEKLIVLGVQKWHSPIPVVSKTDSKDLPEALVKIEVDRNTEKAQLSNIYLGARITATSSDAEQSARIATWLGSYFKEIAAKEAMRDQLFIWLAESTQFTSRALEDKLKLSFEIEQTQIRANSLKKILLQYPELAKSESRQVVDVRKDNERFISPGAQLIGAETQMIDIREKLAQLDREIVQHVFAQNYLEEAEKALGSTYTGSSLVLSFSELTKKYSGKVQNEAEKEKLLSIAAEVSEISARFLSQAQFVLPPNVPSRAEVPRPLMFAGMFGLLGLLLSMTWMFRQWIASQLSSSNAETTQKQIS